MPHRLQFPGNLTMTLTEAERHALLRLLDFHQPDEIEENCHLDDAAQELLYKKLCGTKEA